MYAVCCILSTFTKSSYSGKQKIHKNFLQGSAPLLLEHGVFKVSVLDQDDTVCGTNMESDSQEVEASLHFVVEDKGFCSWLSKCLHSHKLLNVSNWEA